MNRDLFWDRRHNSRLSLWELGDLLGVHPHTLDWRELPDLAQQPTAVIVELARQLAMHPADLVPVLDEVLDNRRDFAADPAADADDGDVAADALIVLTALVVTVSPVPAASLALALGWKHARVLAALRHAEQQPEVTGPTVLTRAGSGWTVRPRLDQLTPEQHKALSRSPRPVLGVTEANALLAVMVLWPRAEYQGAGAATYEQWRADNLAALQRLRDAALIHTDANHTKPQPDHDVLYSLRYDRADPDFWSAPPARP